MNAFGPVVNVDNAAPPYNNTHSLTSNLDTPYTPGPPQVDYHNCVAADDWLAKRADGTPTYKPVWEYMLATPREAANVSAASYIAAPGLFTADASGKGVAAATALRIRADGTQSFEPIARFDAAQNKFVAVPIDLGPENEQVFLILFGTGIRARSALSAVTAKLGGVDCQAPFAGAQGDFAGLDQINVRLPRSLAGRGEVDVALTVDSQVANTVKVSIR
ncbi:MAG: hypothetical protein ACREEM_23540 [Blastocatellia bacterium]